MLARRALLTSATAVFALSLAAPASAQSDKPLPEVATVSILGDMVKRIGGGHVAVRHTAHRVVSGAALFASIHEPGRGC